MSRRYQLPFFESMTLIIAIVILVTVFIPNLKNKNSSEEKSYLFKVSQSIVSNAEIDFKKGINDESILISASSRVNPGPNVEIVNRISPGGGILIIGRNYFACVKLSSTGPVGFLVDYQSEC